MLKFVRNTPYGTRSPSQSSDCGSPLANRSLSAENLYAISDKVRKEDILFIEAVKKKNSTFDPDRKRHSVDTTSSTTSSTTTSSSASNSSFSSWEAMKDGRPKVSFYMDQLNRHVDPVLKSKSPPKKLLKGLLPMEQLLTSLEVDLRLNPNATWLREFVDEPSNGHVLLLKVLKHLQESPSSDRGSVKRKQDVLAVEQNDEHVCLLCLNAIIRNQYGFQKLLMAPRSLSTMAMSLRLSNAKTKVTVLKMLAEACESEVGFEKAMQAMEDFKQVKSEKYRFETLVHSVIYPGAVATPAYQEVVLQFFNSIMANAPTLNQRVFHQQELELAGFNIDLAEKLLEPWRSESVKEQISVWRGNYIDVATTLDEFISLKGRSTLLRDEVDLLQARLEDVERERHQCVVVNKELQGKVEEFKFRFSELLGKLENFKSQQLDSPSDQAAVSTALGKFIEDVRRPLSSFSTADGPSPSVPATSGVVGQGHSTPAVKADFLILPPSVPPLPFNRRQSRMMRCSQLRLPMLNWHAIGNPPENCIFRKLAPEVVQGEVNFAELDELFEIRATVPVKEFTAKREEALKKIANQITVLNASQARNVMITRKRIVLPLSELQTAIDTCDIVMLSSESTEQLLKVLPASDERERLLKYSSEYENLAEAEQFLLKLMQIDRLEQKLHTMTYMGMFDDVVRSVVPAIEAVITASASVVSSSKLEKIIELVLVFGNYINGSRRGYAPAFKLDSLMALADVRSADKKISLLNYLVDVIQKKFPHLRDFADEIEVAPALRVSVQTIAADVQLLRKGLDATKNERDQQGENFVLHNFYNRAMLKVQQIAERYRKMDDQYKEACALFCENARQIEPEDFFQTFQLFIESFEDALRENEERVKEEEILAKAEFLQSRGDTSKRKQAILPADDVRSHFAALGSLPMPDLGGQRSNPQRRFFTIGKSAGHSKSLENRPTTDDWEAMGEGEFKFPVKDSKKQRARLMRRTYSGEAREGELVGSYPGASNDFLQRDVAVV